MANEILRSRHAFGTLSKVLEVITSGQVDAYDILFLKDDNGKPYIGWVDANNEPVIIREDEEVVSVESLPESGETGKIYICGSNGYFWNGSEFINLCNPTDVSALEDELVKLQNAITKIESDVSALTEEINRVSNITKKVKYEISDTPVGTLVKYGEKEIRIMCPSNSVWEKQNVGTGGDLNCYYVTFKTYVPNDEVTGYIEHLNGESDQEVLTTFSTDEYGRRYQPTWLAVAKYDETSNTWTYYGANSNKSHYIGWDYQIDWYNDDGVIIESDNIRINLSNEECHSSIEPYYVLNVVDDVDSKIEEATAESKKYTDEQIDVILSAMEVIVF